MKYFQPIWSWEVDQAIEGDYPYGLPLVECPACSNSKSASGLSYPWVNPESLFDRRALGRMLTKRGAKDCTWNEFNEYAEKLRTKVEANFPLAPGARFGGFQGKVFVLPPHFVMPDPGILLASRSAVEFLKRAGFPLKTYGIKIQSNRFECDHVDVWCPPVGTSSGLETCPECHRGGTKMSGSIDTASIPDAVHFFRLTNNPNFLVFSEPLVDAITKNQLIGLAFKELPQN